MKILFTIVLSLFALLGSSFQTNINIKEYVYVCDSKTAYAYHSSIDCKGLKRCTHEIKKITKQSAIDLGRSACKKCY